MKISYNWLKDYIQIDKTPEVLGEILTAIGLEVEGIETFESVPGGLAGLMTGEVISCEQHPNADKLKLTTVDYGEGPVQIVCGAPNVATGQKVVVAPVGITLYPTNGESFKIKKAKIRGEESFGMICAEDEIGLGEDHEGIIVLDSEVETGKPANTIFEVEQDVIFDIGLTPNRSDATSHIGVAKDVLAFLKVNESDKQKLKMPPVDNFQVSRVKSPIEVIIEDGVGCPRYSGVLISNLTVQESPQWIKNRLKSIGVRPINNIVDATNYVLHEMGQPLHAFDRSKIEGDKIIVKSLPGGSKFLSLDEVERTLGAEDLMICDGESNGMCIAGVFGGINSGVTNDTTEIFLESAHFNAKRIRKTSMNHLLRTDAAMCFEKGSDPNLTVAALKRAAILICQLSGGVISSPLIDVYPKKIEPVSIQVRYKRINSLIGVELNMAEIRDILNALEIQIDNITDSYLIVSIPTNKSDVTREVDVIEEILRIYGFNRVETDDQLNYTFSTGEYPSENFLYNKVSDYLVGNGFNECMSLSLNPSSYYEEDEQNSQLVYINNTSNIHLDSMRISMIPGMLNNINHNQSRQNSNLRLFEFGNTYQVLSPGEFKETAHLTLAVSGMKSKDHWLVGQKAPNSFFGIKSIVINIFKSIGIEPAFQALSGGKKFTEGLNVMANGLQLGKLGKVNEDYAKSFEVKGDVFIADLLWSDLIDLVGKRSLSSKEIPRFPSTRRDLALVIDQQIEYATLTKHIAESGAKWITEIGLFDTFINDELKASGKKSYAIYLVFQHPQKTLQDADVDKSIQKILKRLEKECGAVLR